jgi:ApbE superfamily uncharacterized protein (UPF0280 family)
VPLLRRKSHPFELRIENMKLRVAAPQEYHEESRAAALSFWEQVQSYSRRHPEFRSSKRPLRLTSDAPEAIREILRAAGAAGVGPAFAVQGAMTDHVWRFLSTILPEVTIANAGVHFIRTGRRTKFAVFRDGEGGELKITVDPRAGTEGLATTLGRAHLPARTVDGLGVLATSCMLADAAAAGVMAILAKPEAFKAALDYLRAIDGVQGGVVIQGERIGVVGRVEFAA